MGFLQVLSSESREIIEGGWNSSRYLYYCFMCDNMMYLRNIYDVF